MLKAIIVDDEPYCSETLVTLLEEYCPDIEVAGVYQNGIDAMAGIRQISPNIVFLDVEMPKMNGFEMLEQLPSVNFEIIFTTSYDQYALKAIRFSAIDYLLKPIDQEELVKAVQKVLLGKKYISQAIAEKLANSFSADSSLSPHETLSDREFDVMKLLANGKSVSEIAEMLSLSVTTVSTYRARVMVKMVLKSNSDLTRYAIENKLI